MLEKLTGWVSFTTRPVSLLLHGAVCAMERPIEIQRFAVCRYPAGITHHRINRESPSAMKSQIRNWCLLLLVCMHATVQAAGLPPGIIKDLAEDDSDARVRAIQALQIYAAEGHPEGSQALAAFADGNLKIASAKVFLQTDTTVTDLATGEVIAKLPDGAEDITVNNRLRREIETAQSALELLSPDAAVRLAAAKKLAAEPSDTALPLIDLTLRRESDPAIRSLLAMAGASVKLKSPDAAQRREAARTLAESDDPQTRSILLTVLEKKDGNWAEMDSSVREAATVSLAVVERKLFWSSVVGALFTGFSLGSVLLLAALGLAITYGLMGVINMAHGELLMIGAYSTYLVQGLFQRHFPAAFDWYPLAALPVAFMVCAMVGVVMERTVIRFLYGRPLETLLATWGISLFLIQLVRTLFGAQNVSVENPSWLSGGLQFSSSLVLPWNRIAIIVFAALVLLAVWLILTRTRLGLFVRAVTQNRPMADCTGVPTARVDMLAFGIGSGIAGLGGVALSQIGNVGPDLGQSYIVDSFMVVVLGGVGQLSGTVLAAGGLGLMNKLLEGQVGAVLAKIAILIFIILFIQKRPQGLFALKGRFVEN